MLVVRYDTVSIAVRQLAPGAIGVFPFASITILLILVLSINTTTTFQFFFGLN